ncbi:membrane protein insertase YidC [Candidatus Peregrinibacteria bacterium]|nr:membrane protein insertase YidC [Candidatus Peregrinibacteria bacterium]
MSSNKRLILAIVLCTLVMLVYNFLMQVYYPQKPKKPSLPQQERQEQKKVEQEQEEIAKEEPPKAEEQGEVTQDYELPKVEPKEVPFETGRFALKFSNKGGALVSAKLKNYKNQSGKQDYELLNSSSGALSLNVVGNKIYLSDVYWETESTEDSVIFSVPLPDGLEIKKVFSIRKDEYVIDFKLFITNKGDKDVKAKLELVPFPGLTYDSDYRVQYYHYGFAGVKSTDWAITYLSLPNAKETKPNQEIGIIKQPGMLWAGVKNRHFAGVFIPQDGDFIDSYEFRFMPSDKAAGQPEGNISCILKTTDLEIKPNVDSIFNFKVFLGPQVYDELAKQGNGIGYLFDYTGFDFIGFIILGILNFFYGMVGNYGWAIILTTLIIKIMLFPFDKKSQVSMFKMQKLQPKIVALREKYKNDKQKQGVEQMKLFKEYGVNPFSGCLPVLLSLPIYLGMYSVFDISVELRQSPFLLWISDLSQPDRLTKLPFSFFGYNDLNLLPIIMTVTWLIQSFMMPLSPDPEQRMQQRMMMFMPLLFGFMCYGLASGLSLYFFVNSLFGIIEQKLIKKFYLKA